MPLLSMRLAVLTVSPKKQNRGILMPTTPVVAGPEWIPTRMLSNHSLGGGGSGAMSESPCGLQVINRQSPAVNQASNLT